MVSSVCISITIEGPSPAIYRYDKACDIWATLAYYFTFDREMRA